MMDDVARGTRQEWPSGTVTFLLTDVEGSSRLWEGDPVNAAVAVARSRELVGDAAAAYGGVQPMEQGEGDNVVAAFARATEAVAAAVAAQVALAAEPWPTERGLRVRMALHSGEAVPKADGTYAGAVLNRCARLRALAHGGQVVVSQATRDLVVDHLAEDIGLEDRGTHRLRDLSRPEQVWQLTADGLPSEFPPLRSLDSAPNNLPVQLSSFIGREDDIARSAALLGETRLLTLTGSGGCGKTRLALRVAGEVSDEFGDGVWWVELAPIADGGLIATAVAAAMGVRVPIGREPLQAVIEELGTHRALVVLDNCEHLVADIAVFADRLLRAAPAVKVLATSREPLTVEGEVTWRVPSLGVPPAAVAEPDALGQYDAVRLFIERAVQARPNFAVTNANAPAVAEICHRLDGIPLAIELAAARTRLLSPERIAAELDDRFRLLAGGTRTALPRQQTLLASIDWSHELLDVDERALLRRLGVFAGGFTLDAAEAIATAPPLDRFAVLDLLGQLVSKSLVQLDESTDGETDRYWLLETVRQYALDRLHDAGEAEAARDRHLAWTLELVEALATESVSLHAFNRFEVEHANVRVALDRAAARDQPDVLMRMIGGLALFWAHRGHFAEAQPWFARIPAPGESDGSPHVARARWARAYIAWFNYDLASAQAAASAALNEARHIADRATEARCLATLAFAVALSDFAASRAYASEGLDIASEVGDGWCETLCRFLVASSHIEQGRADEAERVLRAEEGISDPHLSTFVWGFIYLYRGQFADAADCFTTCRELSIQAGNAVYELWASAELLVVAYVRGDPGATVAISAQLTDRTRRWGFLGDVFGVAINAHRHLLEAPGETAAQLASMAELMYGFSDVHDGAMAFYLAAVAALEAADPELAQSCASRPLSDAVRLEAFAVPALDGILGRVALSLDDAASAEEYAHRSLIYQAERGLRCFLADTLELLGCTAIAAESAGEGVRLIAAGDAFRTGIDQHRWPSFQREVDASLDAARNALGDAFDAVWAEGASLTVDDAVAYARRARGDRKRPSFGWASLTPTELDVVRLAAQGLSNPEIGERLFIGRGTVKTHLAHVFTKLGVANRAELAAAATRRQLT